MKKSILFIIYFILFSNLTYAQEYPSITIDDLLTQSEKQKIGLSKLDKGEIDNLRLIIINKYLQGYREGVKKGSEDVQSSFSQNDYYNSNEVIESKIASEFEGWEGETIVKLLNGQIWQQTEYYYEYMYAYMPDVLIYKTSNGYKMKVDGIDKAIGVRRLK